MKFQILVFVLLLACMYPSIAQGSYENCCLKYVANLKRSIKSNFVAFRIQETDGGCNIPAVIFKTKRGRDICADPRQKWVKQEMEKIRKRTI